MDYLPEDQILKFNETTFRDVRRAHGLDSKKLKESIDLLEDWIKKQGHLLKRHFDRGYLERMIIAAKGSVEKAKNRLDRSCTFRTLMPHFFQDFDVKNDFKDFVGKAMITTLPKLTPEHDRVFIVKYVGNEFSTEMFLHVYIFCIMQAEYNRAHDYANSNHIVIDYTPASMTEILLKFSIMELQRLAVVLIEGYGVRIKGIHLILDSKFVDIILSMAKKVVPKKLSSRIQLHRTTDTLKNHISKEVLPQEYGGDEKSLEDLTNDWIDILSSEQFREYWREMSLARTDESKRESGQFNEQYMGMPGSFRSLSVD